LSDQINFGALKLCKKILKLRNGGKIAREKYIEKLVLLLGVEMHLDLKMVMQVGNGL